ncbi:MAG TPA: VCBS repeat-containing protein, partial [Verrucomicrobiae bacterium]|nr:VCBS repeat-containing protein [Verrucomicrobiae bacterium]
MRLTVWTFPVVLLCSCGGKRLEQVSAPKSPSDSTRPAELFQNITDQSGVRFVHRAATNYFMPDQIGSGIAVFDFDQDGRLDLYFVQNALPLAARNVLYHQEQDGSFKDVSAGSGLDLSARGMGAFAADVNNDGLPDLAVTEYGATRLFQNKGHGEFQEVTAEAGLDNPRWAVPASFLDFDRDGWLDLVVGNYVDYDPTQTCHDAQGRQEFCAPAAFPPTTARLWRNVTRIQGATPRFED